MTQCVCGEWFNLQGALAQHEKDCIDSIRAELAASQEREAQLAVDKDRLDWLNRGNWEPAVRKLAQYFGEYDDLRCAIDAARKATK